MAIKPCLFNIRYIFVFYFKENSVHIFCKEFSVTIHDFRLDMLHISNCV